MLRKIVLFFLIFISVGAQAATPTLQDKAPTQYIVKPTDTQWDLATKYLKSPWQWPMLWQAANSSHILLPPIYVGDVLTLTTTKNGAQLTVNHGANLNDNRQLIPPVPLAVLGPFINQSSCLTPAEFGELPYVLSLAQAQSVADKGDSIMARNLDALGTAPKLNQSFMILRKKRFYLDPNDIYKILGVEADYIATAQVMKVGDPTSLQLTQVDQYVQIGDRLQPSPVNPPALQFSLQAPGQAPGQATGQPDKPVRAQIIASLIDYAAINKYSIVAINYGAEDGAIPGQILLATSELSSKKPVGKQIGTLVIFRTFPQVSWAVVMQMSAQMQILNGVQSPPS